jgi:hypothetical protein
MKREPRRAVKVGHRPPAGEALRARSVALHIMECEARRASWSSPVLPGRGRFAVHLQGQQVLAGNPNTRVPVISSLELQHGVVRPQPAGLNQLLGLAAMRGP